MDLYALGEMEEKFALLIWEHAPVSSGTLVKMAAAAFDWKKSTTYTMLKRLCDRGLFLNDGGTVRALITQEEFRVRQGERFLADGFGGSLPKFLAAFTRRNKLKEEEIAALKALIEQHEEGDEPGV